jgi:hypothetical protein
LPYSTYDYGTAAATSFGIQIMNVLTGETRLLVDEDVWMLSWHKISPE